MNNEEIRKLIIAYIESELPAEQRRVVEEYLQKHPEWQREKELLEQTWAMLDEYKAPPVASNFTSQVMRKIEQEEESRPRFRLPAFDFPLTFPRLVPALASFCVIVAIYITVQNYFAKPVQVAEDLPEEARPVQIAYEPEPETVDRLPVEEEIMPPETLMVAVAEPTAQEVIEIPEEQPVAQETEEIFIAAVEPSAVVAPDAPAGRTAPAADAELAALDEEIIRNLDVYENIEFYQNYELMNDYDVIEDNNTEI